jgi:iron complex transport system ATP-binding protein
VGLRHIGELQPTEADFATASELLESMRCGGLADKPFGVLSQGERQQTLVARARMVDPLLIVLDEPCAGMDPGVRERFLAWLDELAAAPTSPSLILVTHHVEEIMPHFESTLVIKRGRIAAAGATASVVTAERLESLYGIGVERLERLAGRLWPIWRVE